MVVIEGRAAEFARQFVAASGAGDAAAEEEAVRWLGSSLARVVAELLGEDDRWDSRHRWIDDFSIFVCLAKPDGSVEADGLIWGEHGTTRQWIEPCHACLRVLANDALAYRLLVGDASREARVEYGGDVEVPVAEQLWRFRFVKQLDRLAE